MSKINKKNKAFEIVAIILIILFAISIATKTLQNDTFYTIKVGELIVKKHGIDMKEHFSWHDGLKYTYPHWLYDVIIYLIYNISGINGIYISTCMFAAILGVIFFEVNKKINKNYIMSFFITILAIYMLKDFITARAQLITYILFILQIYYIERLLEKGNKKYGICLIIISLLMVNLHVAVWPFSFVLYFPYIAEYIISIIIKGKNDNFKLIINKNKNTKILIFFMVCCIFTGLITPLRMTPYTYLINTMRGTTTAWISEHFPIIMINNIDVICVLIVILGTLIFTKTRIRLSDLLMIGGLTILMLYSVRQKSMFVVIGLIVCNRIICDFYKIYNNKLDEILLEEIVKKWVIFTIILCFISVDFCLMFEKRKDQLIDSEKYPVEMSEYILEYFKNTNFSNVRLFNEYNYGNYLLYKGIPVFIDSRADLYSPEFNKNVIVFDDFMQTSILNKDFKELIEEYKITHIILKKDSLIYKVMKDMNSDKYKLLNEDDNFIFYEVL